MTTKALWSNGLHPQISGINAGIHSREVVEMDIRGILRLARAASRMLVTATSSPGLFKKPLVFRILADVYGW
jgi:hypothetical protein